MRSERPDRFFPVADVDIVVGAQYDFTQNLALRGEFERFNGVGNPTSTGNSKVNQLTVGAALKF